MSLTTGLTNENSVIAYEAGADLTGKEGYIVKLSGGKAVLCSAAGEAGIGILVVGGASGDTVSVQLFARSKVVASAALSAGTLFATTAAGKAKVAAVGEFVTGMLLEAASGDGHRVECLITQAGYKPPVNLDDLADVVISEPDGLQMLQYDGVTDKWINTSATLEDLADVDITTPTNGQVLKYDSTAEAWENATDAVS